MNLALEDLRAPIDTAAQVGLVASELLTNAYQHAFPEVENGRIDVRLSKLSDGTVRLEVMDDGVGMTNGAAWPDTNSLGGKIVRSLIDGMGAKLAQIDVLRGSAFNVDVPAKRFVSLNSEAAALEVQTTGYSNVSLHLDRETDRCCSRTKEASRFCRSD